MHLSLRVLLQICVRICVFWRDLKQHEMKKILCVERVMEDCCEADVPIHMNVSIDNWKSQSSGEEKQQRLILMNM